MRYLIALLSLSGALSTVAGVQRPAEKALQIYVIDVEGGEATLFVAPSGESLLVDTGWPGFDGRDAGRIAAAAREAGLEQLDHLVVTHYHADHVGGAAELAARLPIRHFVDHGDMVGDDERARHESYTAMRGSRRRTIATPGAVIPIAGLDVRVLSSAGAVLPAPLPGRGVANPFCSTFVPQGPEITGRAADAGDGHSVSLFVAYGRFETVIMGDLNWNKEFDLMCPTNPVGVVDLYLVSHHGSDTSGSAALVHALGPRAAVMNNGPRKGGAPRALRLVRSSPGLVDLWQNHYAIPSEPELNSAEAFIANLDEGAVVPGSPPGAPPVHVGPAHWIKVTASDDGSFAITNSRTGFSKQYPMSR